MRTLTIVTALVVSLLWPLCATAQMPPSKPVTGHRPPVIDRLPEVIKSMPKARQKGKYKRRSKTIVNCDLSIEEALMVAELRAAIEKLNERRLKLDAREAALKALQAQVQAELEQLRKFQKTLKTKFVKDDGVRTNKKKDEAAKKAKDAKELADTKARVRRERIQQMAKMFKKMKPDEAARIIAKTKDDIAVQALVAIGERAAGKILGQLSPERASALLKILVEQPLPKETP
jgi:flagellar motility protein MotE (MotC chaperone)